MVATGSVPCAHLEAVRYLTFTIHDSAYRAPGAHTNMMTDREDGEGIILMEGTGASITGGSGPGPSCMGQIDGEGSGDERVGERRCCKGPDE
tara:strand:- start:1368 stop:1643 length:276 start_codon:yes stop_codon:yes gene_type:complete